MGTRLGEERGMGLNCGVLDTCNWIGYIDGSGLYMRTWVVHKKRSKSIVERFSIASERDLRLLAVIDLLVTFL